MRVKQNEKNDYVIDVVVDEERGIIWGQTLARFGDWSMENEFT